MHRVHLDYRWTLAYPGLQDTLYCVLDSLHYFLVVWRRARFSQALLEQAEALGNHTRILALGHEPCDRKAGALHWCVPLS